MYKNDAYKNFEKLLSKFDAIDIKYTDLDENENGGEYIASIRYDEGYESIVTDIKSNWEKYNEETNGETYIEYTDYGMNQISFTFDGDKISRILILVEYKNDNDSLEESCSKVKPIKEFYSDWNYDDEELSAIYGANADELIQRTVDKTGDYSNEFESINENEDADIVVEYIDDAWDYSDDELANIYGGDTKPDYDEEIIEWDSDVFDDQYDDGEMPILEKSKISADKKTYKGQVIKNQDWAQFKIGSYVEVINPYNNKSLDIKTGVSGYGRLAGKVKDTYVYNDGSDNLTAGGKDHNYGELNPYAEQSCLIIVHDDFKISQHNNKTSRIIIPVECLKEISEKDYKDIVNKIPRKGLNKLFNKNKKRIESKNNDIVIETWQDDWVEPTIDVNNPIEERNGLKIYKGTDQYGEEAYYLFPDYDPMPEPGYEEWQAETLELAQEWADSYEEPDDWDITGYDNYDLDESLSDDIEIINKDVKNESESSLSLNESIERRIYTALENIAFIANEYDNAEEDLGLENLKQSIDIIEEDLKVLKDIRNEVAKTR